MKWRTDKPTRGEEYIVSVVDTGHDYPNYYTTYAMYQEFGGVGVWLSHNEPIYDVVAFMDFPIPLEEASV